MKVYGITGGAGTGKSEVIRILRDELGGYVILTDDVARALQQKGQICYRLMVAHFGEGILGEDGEIDRPGLAAIVFSDAEQLAVLNSLTHPYVREEVLRQLDQARAAGYAFAAVESAILLEAGYGDICDEFWYVYTDPEIRRQRMKETRGYSDEKVDQVMKNQKPDAVFFESCDFVITNNSTLEEVRRQLIEKLSVEKDN